MRLKASSLPLKWYSVFSDREQPEPFFSLSKVSQEEQIELTQACREFGKLWRNINTREAMLRLHWVIFIRDVNRQCSWVHSVNPLPMPAWEFSAAQRRTDSIMWKWVWEKERERRKVCLFHQTHFSHPDWAGIELRDSLICFVSSLPHPIVLNSHGRNCQLEKHGTSQLKHIHIRLIWSILKDLQPLYMQLQCKTSGFGPHPPRPECTLCAALKGHKAKQSICRRS